MPDAVDTSEKHNKAAHTVAHTRKYSKIFRWNISAALNFDENRSYEKEREFAFSHWFLSLLTYFFFVGSVIYGPRLQNNNNNKQQAFEQKYSRITQ